MSTTVPTRPAAGTATGGPRGSGDGVTFRGILLSEWIKFRSLRSSWITLLSGVALMVLLAVALSYAAGSGWATAEREDTAVSGAMRGYFLAQLLIGVLGVLFVSGEHGTGMIRSTLTAVPRRLPVVAGKAVTFGAVVGLTMVAATSTSFLAAQAALSRYGHAFPLTAPGVVQTVLGTAFYLAMIGLLGGALGWIVRSTAGAIGALFALLLIIPTLLQLFSWQWLKDVGPYLPSEAGRSIISSYQVPGALGAGAGFAVLTAWALVPLLIGAVLLRRRDG